jgi:hypothetical protein
MLVVVASRQDSAASDLVSRWAPYGAALLTVADLSAAGWRHQVGEAGGAGEGAAVVDGRAIATGDITGVLTRLPFVSEAELAHIHPDDRRYVAAEMTAFLAAWLSRLRCLVLNRPTPGCLAGPAWRLEQWVHLAVRIGLPVRPVRRSARLSDAISLAAETESTRARDTAAATVVTVVGEYCFGADDPGLAAQARRLARATGVDLLSIQFAGPGRNAELVGVSLWADVTSPEIAAAIAAYLRGSNRC